jgi:hypothetical protein
MVFPEPHSSLNLSALFNLSRKPQTGCYMPLPRTTSAEPGKPRKGRGWAQEQKGRTAGSKAELSPLCPTPLQPILLSVSLNENRFTPGNTSEQPLVPTSIPLLYPQGASRPPPHIVRCNLHPPDPSTFGPDSGKLHLSFITSTPSPCPRLASLFTKVASNLQDLYSPPVLTSPSQVFFSKSLSKELLVPKGPSWRWRFP